MSPVENLICDLLPVILRAMRRKKMLEPADRTEIASAAQKLGLGTDLRQRLLRIVDETPMDREEKRETPRKPN